MRRILKSKIFLIFIIAGVVIVLSVLFFGGRKPVKIGEIRYFSFSYSAGYAAYSNVNYKLELKDGVYTATVKPLDEPDEVAKVFSVDESFVRELEQFLIDNKVGKWNGFKKASKMILDGDGFSLYIAMTDGTSLDASGYMKWPKNYAVVKGGIDALFGARMEQGIPSNNSKKATIVPPL